MTQETCDYCYKAGFERGKAEENKRILDIIESHRNTDKSFETDEWFVSENLLIDKLKSKIQGEK